MTSSRSSGQSSSFVGSRPSRPTPRRPLGRVGAIASTAAATVDLAGDRGVGAAELTTDRAGRFSSGYPARDLLTLGEGQATLRPTARPRPDPSHPLQVLAHRPLRHPEPATDLGLAHPLRSQLPDRVLHSLGQVVTPRHLRTSLVGQRIADSLGWCGGSLKPPGATSISASPAVHLLRADSRYVTTHQDGPGEVRSCSRVDEPDDRSDWWTW